MGFQCCIFKPNRLAYRRSEKGVVDAGTITLVTACDTAIRAHGIGIVTALVESDNTASAVLFETLGYRADVPVRCFRKLGSPSP